MITSTLLRTYRAQLIWFLSTMVITVAVLEVLWPGWIQGANGGGLWSLIFGTAAKYWLAVLGVILIPLQLRAFVANGITRRAFVAGAAGYGLVLAAILAVVVTAGRIVESVWLDGTVSAAAVAGDFARDLPALLVAGLAGLVIGLVAVRFRPVPATLAMVPVLAARFGLLWLLGAAYNDAGAPLPLYVSVPLSLAALILAYAGTQRLAAGTAIRPAAA